MGLATVEVVGQDEMYSQTSSSESGAPGKEFNEWDGAVDPRTHS